VKNQFESILNHVNEGILISSRHGRILLVNPRCCEMFGYTQNELMNLEVESLIPREKRERHVQHREEYKKKPTNRGMGKNMTLHGLRKDNSIFPVEISLSHYESDGETFVVAFIIDISERINFQENLERMNHALKQLNENLEKKVEERTLVLQEALNDLEKSRDELEQSWRKEKELHEMKSRFVSMASHEFRTPLTTILSSVSLLAKYTEDNQEELRIKHIQRIKNSVFTLTDNLNDVLSLGKLDEGKVEVQIEEIDLNEFCKVCLEDIDSLLKPNQKFEIQIPNNLYCKADSALLHRALINLISNAIKFSFEGEAIFVKARIRQSLSDYSVVAISVSNMGIGIPVEEQEKLFDRFYRAKNAVNVEGTGLGLSIVKRCCELMGADIEWQSEENKETVFTLLIPH
jgi:PAS domain S-box-containing protein